MGNKISYYCPGCGEKKWAYGSFAGSRCWECPGTIISAVTNATPVIRQIKTVCQTATNQQTKYPCPGCGEKVWAYGQFVGQKCWQCKSKNPLSGLFDIGLEVTKGASAFK